MSDPLRRLSPVVRLAPAKLNLTLAVVGRRDDGYHALHSVFVPLALADRLSLAPVAGHRDTLHVTGLDAGPAGRQPRVPRARRRPRGGRRRLAGRTRSGPGPRRPAREADPGRGRAGRRLVRRRGDGRRRARGVGRGARRRRPACAGRAISARTSRSSSPADRPWSKAAASRSRRSPGSTGRPASSSSRRSSPSRRPMSSPRSMPSGATATARSGCRPPISPRSSGPSSRRRTSSRGPGVLASANDLLPATSLVVPELVPFKRALEPRAPPPDRAVGLRSDALGALSFGGRGHRGRGGRPGRHRRRATLAAPGSSEPFVCATTIVGHSQPGRGTMTRRPSPPRARPPPSGRTARGSSPTGCCSAPARRALDPATGDARRGRHRARDRAGHGQPDGRARCGRRVVVATWSRRRSSSSTWPTSRRSTRSTAGSCGDPPPARSTVGVAALPKGARVEIEAVATARLTPPRRRPYDAGPTDDSFLIRGGPRRGRERRTAPRARPDARSP